MFTACATRTMAGAAQRAAQRGRALVVELPPPGPQPKVWVAPELPRVVIQMPESPYYQRRRIIDLMARIHGVKYASVVGPRRFTMIVAGRQAAMCAVKEWETICGRNMSFPQLGRLFGGRDHTTIISAFRARGYRPPLPATRICT